MEKAVGSLQLLIALMAVIAALSLIKIRDKNIVLAATASGVILLIHIALELFEQSDFLYSVTGLLYALSVIGIVFVLGVRQLKHKE